MARSWPVRTAVIPAAVKLDNTMLNEIEDYLRDMETVTRKFRYGMNALVMILAKAQQGFAQEYSRGPVDPRATNKGAAWKIPVRRITSHYYQGWQAKRVAPGVWITFNATREAYFIEFGIHTSAGRVRRPIRKLSLMRTLHFADTSRVGPRVWEEVYGPMRGTRFRGRGSGIIGEGVQSPPVMSRL